MSIYRLVSPRITLPFPQLCQLNVLTLWTRLSTWCQSRRLYPLRSRLACFCCNRVTFDVLLLKCTGTDSLTGQVYLASFPQHNENVICPEMAHRACPLPEKLWTSRKLADASQLLTKPSTESGQDQGHGWHQQALLLCTDTHAVLWLSAAEQWGMEKADHLVHEALMLNVLW